MCGGRGTRLDADVEKPLFEVGGRPMVDRVRDALTGSRIGTVCAVVSPHAPRTREHVSDRMPVVETPGEGYVADLDAAMADERVARPVVTCVADLPLLTAGLVDEVLDAYATRTAGSLTVAVPAALKRALGVSVDTTMLHEGRQIAPVGLNVVGQGADATWLSHDARLAVNVNRRADAAVAERLRSTDDSAN
jgi:adenosylcobinamide-phosphate guanylyltransferase